MTLQAHCGSDLSLGGLGDLPVVAFFEKQTATKGHSTMQATSAQGGYVCAGIERPIESSRTPSYS